MGNAGMDELSMYDGPTELLRCGCVHLGVRGLHLNANARTTRLYLFSASRVHQCHDPLLPMYDDPRYNEARTHSGPLPGSLW